jgi:hypothetical protein
MLAVRSSVVVLVQTSYEMITNAHLDNSGLSYFLPLLHKKMWSINEVEDEHIEYI